MLPLLLLPRQSHRLPHRELPKLRLLTLTSSPYCGTLTWSTQYG